MKLQLPGKVGMGLDWEFGIDVHIDIFKIECFFYGKEKLLTTPLRSSLKLQE